MADMPEAAARSKQNERGMARSRNNLGASLHPPEVSPDLHYRRLEPISKLLLIA
jgi:hypothetical protein